MWLQFSGTLLFSKYLKEFRSVFQPQFLFLYVANTGAPGGKVFSSACAQHGQTSHPQSSSTSCFLEIRANISVWCPIHKVGSSPLK